MTPELMDLAREVVKCSLFQWSDGMRDQHGRRYTNFKAGVIDGSGSPSLLVAGIVGARVADPVPDITDAPTAARLLEMLGPYLHTITQTSRGEWLINLYGITCSPPIHGATLGEAAAHALLALEDR